MYLKYCYHCAEPLLSGFDSGLKALLHRSGNPPLAGTLLGASFCASDGRKYLVVWMSDLPVALSQTLHLPDLTQSGDLGRFDTHFSGVIRCGAAQQIVFIGVQGLQPPRIELNCLLFQTLLCFFSASNAMILRAFLKVQALATSGAIVCPVSQL